MSTTVTVTCNECREVQQVDGYAITLEIYNDPALSNYQFACPGCGQHNKSHANDQAVNVLLGGGIVATLIKIPEEALEPKTGPVLTPDDLLDFVLALESEDLLANLARA